MLFNSWEFALFILVIYAGYLLLRGVRAQNLLLLFASYWFYGAWDWRFLSLIVISTVVDYWCGAGIHRSLDDRIRKRLLFVSVAMNLGLLAFFKYFNFFVESLEGLLGDAGVDASDWRLGIVLPVGISFYTFQTMSYSIDIYRKEMEPAKSPLDFALFVAFFPQLVAGPIERAKALLPQMRCERVLEAKTFSTGVWLIFWGLWKKIFIADNLSAFVDPVFENSADVTAGMAYLGVVAFAFQIYCDFSGYSDIARGLSRIMGFELRRNFDLPYFARNPSDFWRRWHISLSSWLRDYLYIPLGGNRGGSFGTYRNLSITMLLGGLWHGASWNFVWWGIFHGLLLIGHRLWTVVTGPPAEETTRFGAIWSTFAMFQFTLMGWLLFRATRRVDRGDGTTYDDSWAQIMEILAAPGRGWGFDSETLAYLAQIGFYILPLAMVQWFQWSREDHYVMLKWPMPVRSAFYSALLFLWVFYGAQVGTSFIYFQF